MPTQTRPALLRRWARGRKRWRELELADMGTAFALDAALADEAAASATAATAAAAPSRRAGPVAVWRLWLRRKSGA